ncbi:CD151 antigen-like [Stegodyphus dumicola]|uniref:CD151 antigen-like n=1 Tax=Stegodyphus dumicola TaxID=202533 RepID=UPI0015AF6051|nr:CD151 antigen-like [Stegodyphus dumicola]
MATTDKKFAAYFRRSNLPRFRRREKTYGRPPVFVRSISFFGVVCLVTGGWLCSKSFEPFTLDGEAIKYRLPDRLLLFSGSMLLVTGITSIWTAGILIKVAIMTLMHGLCLALLLETIAGAVSYSFSTAVKIGAFNKTLLEEVKQRYGLDQTITYFIDRLHKSFHCCGVSSYRDWTYSKWMINMTNSDLVMAPLSCCERVSFSCRNFSIFFNPKGCGAKATSSLKNHLNSVMRCAFICLFIHVNVYLVSLYLERKV